MVFSESPIKEGTSKKWFPFSYKEFDGVTFIFKMKKDKQTRESFNDIFEMVNAKKDEK